MVLLLLFNLFCFSFFVSWVKIWVLVSMRWKNITFPELCYCLDYYAGSMITFKYTWFYKTDVFGEIVAGVRIGLSVPNLSVGQDLHFISWYTVLGNFQPVCLILWGNTTLPFPYCFESLVLPILYQLALEQWHVRILVPIIHWWAFLPRPMCA